MRIKMKLTALVNRKLGEVKSVKKEDLLQFGKNCLPMLFTIGFFLITNDASAQTTSTAGNVGITPLQKPLQVITDALTGPIPILVTGGGIALGGMSWAMGWAAMRARFAPCSIPRLQNRFWRHWVRKDTTRS